MPDQNGRPKYGRGTFAPAVPELQDELKPAVDPPSTSRRVIAGGIRVGSQVLAGIPANFPGLGSVGAAAIGGLGELGAQAVEEGVESIFDAESMGRAGVEAGLAVIPGRVFLTPGRVAMSAMKSGVGGAAGEAMREYARGEEISPSSVLGVGALSAATGGFFGRFLPKTADEAAEGAMHGPETFDDWIKGQNMDIPTIAKKAAEWQKQGMADEAHKLRVAGIKQHELDPKLGQKLRLEVRKHEVAGDGDSAQGLRVAAMEANVQDLKLADDAAATVRTQQTAKTALGTRDQMLRSGAKPKTTVSQTSKGLDPETGKTITVTEKLVRPKKGLPAEEDINSILPVGSRGRTVYDGWRQKGLDHYQALDLTTKGADPRDLPTIPPQEPPPTAPRPKTPKPPTPPSGGAGAAAVPPTQGPSVAEQIGLPPANSPEGQKIIQTLINLGKSGGPDAPPAPVPTAPTPDIPPTPTGAVAEPPVQSGGALSPDLAGAKPRFNIGNVVFEPSFESDLDKAAYIIAQVNKSRRDADYLKFVTDTLGVDENTARKYGQIIRERIKGLARNNKNGGVLRIPRQVVQDTELGLPPRLPGVSTPKPPVSNPTDTPPPPPGQGKAAQGASEDSKLVNPNIDTDSLMNKGIGGTKTTPEARDAVPGNAAFLERRAKGSPTMVGGKRAGDPPAVTPAVAPEPTPAPTTSALDKTTLTSLKNLGYSPGVIKNLSPEQIKAIVTGQKAAPALSTDERIAIITNVIRSAYAEVPDLAEKLANLSALYNKARAANDPQARVLGAALAAETKAAEDAGMIAVGFGKQVSQEITQALDDITLQKIAQEGGQVVEGGMAPIRIDPSGVGMLPGKKTPSPATPEPFLTARVGEMSADLAKRMQSLRDRANAGEDVTEEVNALQRELLGGAPPAPKTPAPDDVPPAAPAGAPKAKVTRSKAAGAAAKAQPKVDTPKEAAGEVVDELERVVNVEGAKTAAEIQRRVLATLEEELAASQSAQKFGPIEIVPRKAYGGKEFDVLVNGEPVAEVSHVGKITAHYNTDEKLLEALGAVPSTLKSGRPDLGVVPQLRGMSAKEMQDWVRSHFAKKLGAESGAGRITVQIPGDGTFSIFRNPVAIQEVIDRVKRGGASPWRDLAEQKPKPSAPKPQSAESAAAEAFRVERQAADKAAGVLPVNGGSGEGMPSSNFTTPNTQKVIDKFNQKGGTTIGAGLGGFDIGILERNPVLATRLGSAAFGALTGAAIDPLDDPFSSMVMGGVAGFSLPSLVKGMKSVGADLNDPAVRKSLSDPNTFKKTASTVFHLLPHIQRFNYLASEGLLANAFIGPFGAGFFGALGKAVSGDPRAWIALRMMSPGKWSTEYYNSWTEASKLLQSVEAGNPLIRAELHGPGLDAIPSSARKVLQTPAQAMTAGDLATRKILLRAGFSEQEAREITLTAEPYLPMMRKLANLRRGQRSPGMELLFPFVRTPANVFEQGLTRMPGIGFAVQEMREAKGAAKMSLTEQAGQQAVGFMIGVASYVIGSQMSPETAKTYRRFVTNAAGPYSMIAALGFSAGQATQRSGMGPVEALGSPEVLREAEYSLPLPSTGPVTDIYNYLRGARETGPGLIGTVQRFLGAENQTESPIAEAIKEARKGPRYGRQNFRQQQ